MNLREQFEKETGIILPNLNSMPSVKAYTQWLEQRNAEMVEVLKLAYARLGETYEYDSILINRSELDLIKQELERNKPEGI